MAIIAISVTLVTVAAISKYRNTGRNSDDCCCTRCSCIGLYYDFIFRIFI